MNRGITVASLKLTRTQLPIQLWRWCKRKTNVWRMFFKHYTKTQQRAVWDDVQCNQLSIIKPHNQFFITIRRNKFYSYSTGLILRAIKHPQRSLRRTAAGVKLLFGFVLRKLRLAQISGRWVFFIKTLNNFNTIKHQILKCVDALETPTSIYTTIKKNYTFNKYKKVSYLKRRIRQKYVIE